MMEPMPGTQAIYEYITDCPWYYKSFYKAYPSNSTVIVNNPCSMVSLYFNGDIAKLVVEANIGNLTLGEQDYTTSVTPEVVVYQNTSRITLPSKVGSVNIRENYANIDFYDQIEEYLAVKVNKGKIWLANFASWNHLEISIEK